MHSLFIDSTLSKGKLPAKTHHITFICGRFRYIVSQKPDLCCGELEPIRNVGQEVKNKNIVQSCIK